MSGVLLLAGSAGALALASALHCAGMCGAFALVARSGPAWHLGKALSYVGLGVLAGSLGGAVSAAAAGPGLGIAVGVVASVVLVGSAAQLAGLVPPGIGGRFGRWLGAPLRRLAEPSDRPPRLRRFVFGLANGLVPCGVVYAGLALAAVAGGPLEGALVMGVFALGTAPVLVAVGLGGGRLSRLRGSVALRRGVAIAALLIGLTSVWWRTPLHAADEPPACHEE